ncbi:Adaptive-response sensory-kinase SasA [subsurface metagenome]
MGANTFIRKPTEPDVLVQMLRESVENAQSGALAPAKAAPLEPSLFLTEYTKRIVAKLEDKVAQLEMEITHRKQAEHDLNERVKELECLYGIAMIAARPGVTLDTVYQEVANLIPQGWQYPDITCARVTIDGKEFKTPNYRETAWKQAGDIIVDDQQIGTVEVSYLEEKPERDEGPFQKQERALIDALARHLGETIERKQAEENIKRAAEEWRTTFDSITDFVSICDKDFRLVRVNKAFADVVKMKPEELIGKHCYEIVHGANEPLPNCPHKVTIETKKPATVEFFEPHLGIHLAISTSPIFNENGEVVASVHLIRDITERKRMEGQLIITDRLASIGELSSGIAHELNNPLTSVIGFSELLLDKDVPDDVKEDLEVINREAKRTAGVVRNLLTFARKHEAEKKPVDIHNIIQKVLELRAYEQKVSNIEVNTRFAPDLPEITADGFQLQQVFINIIINAEHFMIEAHRRGTLTITTERVGDIIRASFADDGPGIAKENLGHLFDPFFTTKEVGKGTGLGLSICYGIITEHGGRIYAESKLGKGATFVVELPISKQ